jgi:hypothetical protein
MFTGHNKAQQAKHATPACFSPRVITCFWQTVKQCLTSIIDVLFDNIASLESIAHMQSLSETQEADNTRQQQKHSVEVMYMYFNLFIM